MPLVRLIITAVLAVTAVTALDATPANAAVGCTYSDCTGKDPNVQNCSDGRTPDSYYVDNPSEMNGNLGNLYVELRHSDACHARWARGAWKPSDFGCGGGGTMRLRIRNFGTIPPSPVTVVLSTQAVRLQPCDTVWTDMTGRTSSSSYSEFCHQQALRNANGDITGWASIVCKTQKWP